MSQNEEEGTAHYTERKLRTAQQQLAENLQLPSIT